MPTLRELDADAAPRPWRAYFTVHGDPHVIGSATAHRRDDGEPIFPQDLRATVSTSADDYGRADAELIATARNALPVLLDLADAWREQLAEHPDESNGSACDAARALGELDRLLGPQADDSPQTGRDYAVLRHDGWHLATWDGQAFEVTSAWQSGDRWPRAQVRRVVPLPRS